jgi:hypothetical protein
MPGRIRVRIASDGTYEGGTEIIGHETEEATNSTGWNGQIRLGGKDTVLNTGEITSISVYCRNIETPTADMMVGVYLDNAGSPDTLIGSAVLVTDMGVVDPLAWYKVDTSGNGINVTAGQTVWLGATVNSAGVSCRLVATAGTELYGKAHTIPDAWPDPITGLSSFSYNMSIKATVTY